MSAFLVSVKGQLESAAVPDIDELFVKFQFVIGDDWQVTAGFDESLTQVSQRYDNRKDFIFAFPIDVTFKSTNPSGWPQMVVCTYGRDVWGHEVLRGYGVTRLPVSPGSRIVKTVGLFTPENSSIVSKLSSWFTGRYPELQDPRMLARNRGRELLRTTSQGCVTLSLDIIIKDMATLGYEISSRAQKKEELSMNGSRVQKPPRNTDALREALSAAGQMRALSIDEREPSRSQSEEPQPPVRRRRKQETGLTSPQDETIEPVPAHNEE